jgi:hypothetical protein
MSKLVELRIIKYEYIWNKFKFIRILNENSN